MPSLIFRKNLLISLFVISIVLILLQILFSINNSDSQLNNEIVSVPEIRDRFLNILYDSGIEESLIKELETKEKFFGEEISNFKIRVPSDLSIPEILLSIYQSFRKDSLQISSVELKKGGKSILKLHSNDITILKAEFEYSKKAFRDRGSIAFILKNTNPADASIAKLIESPIKLNFLLRPDITYLQHLNFIKENGKQFSVLIDDEITEQKYKLGPGFSQNRIVTVLKTLVTDFYSAAFFVIDDQSEFYNSANREIFTNELKKRGIKIFEISDFVHLQMDEQLINSFNEIIENLKSDDGILFLVDEETFSSLDSEIEKYRKKGYKIVNSSLLIDRLN